MLDFVARLTWRRPKLVLALSGLFLVVAGGLGHDVERHLKAAGFTDSASQSERATALLHRELGYEASPGIVVLVRDRGGGRLDVADPAVRREVDRVARALEQTRFVGHVVNPLRDRREGRALLERDGRSLVLAAHLSTQDIESDGGEAAEEAQRRIGSSPLDVRMGGFGVSFNEVNDETREDLTRAELIAFPILTVLLLLVFRGVVAAAVPLLLGVASVLGTFLVLRVMAGLVDTSLFALNVATALSLGLAVDYALLMVSRFREEVERAGAATEEAHRRTVLTAGRTILFSGLTIAAAMASLIIMPQRFLYSIGAAGAAVGLLSATMAVLAVPAVLALLGTRINALAIRRGPAISDDSTGWYRVARAAMRRPVLVALGCTALLLAAASPLLRTELTGPSAEAVPPSQPSYAVNQYIESNFSRGVAFPISVTVPEPASPAQLATLQRQIAALDGIDGGTPFVRASPTVAFANFVPAQPALDERVQDAVHEIRALRLPGGGELLVSGNTARFIRREGEPRRAPAARRRDDRRADAAAAVRADRLDPPADQDAPHERPDARRLARRDRARLPGRPPRRPLRVHRAGGPRGDEPRLPRRRDVRAGDRLRGARHGPHQGAARPRREQRGRGGDRDRPHGARHHRGGGRDRRRLPRLRRQQGLLHEADLDRRGGRGAGRHDDRARPARARAHGSVRRVELVGAGSAAAPARALRAGRRVGRAPPRGSRGRAATASSVAARRPASAGQA
jgi:putative drug exporter of the RND superfamily